MKQSAQKDEKTKQHTPVPHAQMRYPMNGLEVDFLLFGAAINKYGTELTPQMPPNLRKKSEFYSKEHVNATLRKCRVDKLTDFAEVDRQDEETQAFFSLRKFCSGSMLTVEPTNEITKELLPIVTTGSSCSSPMKTGGISSSSSKPTCDHRSDLHPQRVVSVRTPPDWKGRKEFAAAAEKYGVQRAYHGSATSNWFSIVHCGLRNLAGTAKTTRSLFGEGIYLTSSLHVAHDFSSFEPSLVEHSPIVCSSKFKVVGVFDVALDPNEVRTEHSEEDATPKTYIVVKHPAMVQLRYLLIYGEAGELHEEVLLGDQFDASVPLGSKQVSAKQQHGGEQMLRKGVTMPSEGAKQVKKVGLLQKFLGPYGPALIVLLVAACVYYYFIVLPKTGKRARLQDRFR